MSTEVVNDQQPGYVERGRESGYSLALIIEKGASADVYQLDCTMPFDCAHKSFVGRLGPCISGILQGSPLMSV